MRVEQRVGRATPGCLAAATALLAALNGPASAQDRPQPAERPRARDSGVLVGGLPTGSYNAITDVSGVLVGHHTVWVGDSIRTGVTAILPHGGNLFQEKVAGAIAVGNGFGKLVGLSQVNELGQIETPILLTGTLSVFRAADALVDTMLAIPENRRVTSINPVVGETNDGYLSDVRARPVAPEHVRAALRQTHGGAVEEGSVGAGTGTRTHGWKGGIGTASRVLAESLGGYTVGVLVQSNFLGTDRGRLRIEGVPVGAELVRMEPERGWSPVPDRGTESSGSIMIVLATDAPLSHRELQRLARRAFLGVARTGHYMYNGSGDYAIAFSTSSRPPESGGRLLSRLFLAAVEATEEAVINSLFKATPVTGFGGRRVEALPIDATLEILARYGVVSEGDQ